MIRVTNDCKADFIAAAYTLAELEITIDEGGCKIGPGAYASLPYIAGVLGDTDAVRTALAAHLAQTDAHGDRAYADALGIVGGSTVTSILDTDKVLTRAGLITVANLSGQIVNTARFNTALQADLSYLALAAAQTTLVGNVAALSTQSSVYGQHGVAAVAANTVTVQQDFYAGSAAAMNVGDRLTYTYSGLWVNTSGVDQSFPIQAKINAINIFTKTGGIILPSATGAYPVTYQSHLVQGASNILHTIWAFMRVYNAATPSVTAPNSGVLFDYCWPITPGSDYGVVKQSHEWRVNCANALSTVSTQRIESSLLYTAAP